MCPSTESLSQQLSRYFRNAYARPLVPSLKSKLNLQSQLAQICLGQYSSRKKPKPQVYNAFCTVFDLEPVLKEKYKAEGKLAKAKGETMKAFMFYRNDKLKEMYSIAEPAQIQKVQDYIGKCDIETKKRSDQEEFLLPEESSLPESEKVTLVQLRKRQR